MRVLRNVSEFTHHAQAIIKLIYIFHINLLMILVKCIPIHHYSHAVVIKFDIVIGYVLEASFRMNTKRRQTASVRWSVILIFSACCVQCKSRARHVARAFRVRRELLTMWRARVVRPGFDYFAVLLECNY